MSEDDRKKCQRRKVCRPDPRVAPEARYDQICELMRGTNAIFASQSSDALKHTGGSTMPNGHFNAQCFNCLAFVYRRNGRSCRKHDVLMPRVSAELICRDWRHREGSENPAEIAEYGALEPNVLYYYHYTSDAPRNRSPGSQRSQRPSGTSRYFTTQRLVGPSVPRRRTIACRPHPVHRARSISMVRRIVSRSSRQYGAASSVAGVRRRVAGRTPGGSDQSASCITR